MDTEIRTYIPQNMHYVHMQAISTSFVIISRVPQIVSNFRTRDVENLAIITWLLNFAGASIRVSFLLTYVHTHVCMYIYIYIYISSSCFVCKRILNKYIHTYIHITYIHGDDMRVLEWMHVIFKKGMYIRKCIQMYARTHTYMYVCIHIQTMYDTYVY
jgi:hypothetical protein